MTRGALILIAVMLLMAAVSEALFIIHPGSRSGLLNAKPSGGRAGQGSRKIHEALRQVLMARLVEEDLEKQTESRPRQTESWPRQTESLPRQPSPRQTKSEAYDLVQKSLKAQMDAEDSRKIRGNMKPVAHRIVKQAITKRLDEEHNQEKDNRALHNAVRQAVVNGLIVEHNPRSGSYILHDAVRQAVNVNTDSELDENHNWNNAVDDAVVNQLLRQGRQKKIHDLLRQVLKLRLEEEDVSGSPDRPVHNRVEQVMRALLAQEDGAPSSYGASSKAG